MRDDAVIIMMLRIKFLDLSPKVEDKIGERAEEAEEGRRRSSDHATPQIVSGSQSRQGLFIQVHVVRSMRTSSSFSSHVARQGQNRSSVRYGVWRIMHP